MELFGHQVQLKTHNCKFNGNPGTPKQEQTISLYVRFKGCNAQCSFCEYMDDANSFDLIKYKEVLLYLKEHIRIHKINFTGGEPTLNWKLFNQVINVTREIFPKVYLVLNTNGYNLQKLFDEDIYKQIDSISLSRHHYDDNKNIEILKTHAPSEELIKYAISKIGETSEKIHLTCNLVKNYIDSDEEAIKYLEWAAKLDIETASFVTLMPINDFCKNNFIKLDLEKYLHQTKLWEYENICSCSNWVFFPNDPNSIPLRIYTKNTFNPFGIITSLVYDGKNVKLGFTEKIIY